ncbi:carboxypeptidase-like regulatory domain-containing protein [Spirosoma telluris]|uniref:carboxypeptidase-like regulatory domain-containing protein n=1 Tax=Spirosoma telluris TaxID=2183553 RepID=UPI002FC293CA
MKSILLLRSVIGLMCLLLITLVSQAQSTRTLTGRISDAATNGALPGVNVLVKGTQQGTTTNADGQYTLNVPASAATLTFSFIGYVSQDVDIANRSTIDVSLKADDRSLNEVVVVGYGTQRKIETTGSIASVKAADLVQTPVANVAQGLQSRVAGVQVSQNTGAPGGNISVRIRGRTRSTGVPNRCMSWMAFRFPIAVVSMTSAHFRPSTRTILSQ